MKRTLLVISLLCFGIRPYAQGLPEVIPPTPDVAALGKFGEYPVANNYGTVPVSIPLFELRSGDITLPVSISYHTSGIKVNEEASSIGLGWSLNAGGTISKSVRGADDRSKKRDLQTKNTSFLFDGSATLNNYYNVKPTLAYEDGNHEVFFLDYRIVGQEVDGQSDVYFFNFMDRSGKFVFKGGGTNDVLIYPVQQNLKFDFKENVRSNLLPGTGYMDGFHVTADNGLEYWFYDQESVLHTSPTNVTHKTATAWNLSHIHSMTSDSYILFDYDDFDYSKWNYSYYNDYDPTINAGRIPSFFTQAISSNYFHRVNSTSVDYQTKALKEIRAYDHNDVGGAKLVLETAEDREDQMANRGFRYKSITLFDKYGQQIKKAIFHHSYFNAKNGYVESFANNLQGKKRMRLDSVTIIGKTNAVKQVYRFEYHSEKLPHINSLERDYWGYYNGRDAQKILPSAPYTSYNGADLNSHPDRILAGSLKRVHYPTGGYTEFEFEANEVRASSTTMPITEPITKIYSESGICQGNHNAYIYREVDVTGVVNLSVDVTINFPNIPANAFGGTHPKDVVSGNFVTIRGAGSTAITVDGTAYYLDAGFYKHDPVTVQNQTFVNQNTGGQDLILVSYRYICDNGGFNAYGPQIRINYDRLYGGSGQQFFNAPAGGLRIKKITNRTENGIAQIKEYGYTHGNGNSTGTFVHTGGLPTQSYTKQEFWGGATPGAQGSKRNIIRVFDRSLYDLNISGSPVCYGKVTETLKNGSGQALGRTEYRYGTTRNSNSAALGFPFAPLEDKGHKRSLKSKRVYNASNDLVYKDTIVDTYTGLQEAKQLLVRGLLTHRPNGTGTDFFNEQKAALWEYDWSKIAVNYYNGGGFSDGFGADPNIENHYSIINEYMSGSQVTTTRYDTDGNNPITTVTTNTYDNPAHLQVTRSEIRDSSGDGSRTKMYYPDDIGTSLTVGGNLDATDASVIGLLRGENRKTVPIQTEIYELEGLLPTAKLISVQRNLYGSFGGMLLPKNVQTAKGNDNVEPRIVHYGYDAQGNPQEVSREDGAHRYYIWGYDGQYPIAKLENFTSADAATVQTLINAAVTASDADNDNCGNASCKEQQLRNALDAIRNHSASSKAMVTTYTYDPLVGITSMTDPKGYTTYYEYDDFNRLKSVKDAGNNLVTDYEYHYKN
ncbi:hypothetical protein FGF1_40990 [Flavobacteriaceae bacterium GF1]